ncbi:dephospho-CoA kinase, partial [Luminiphilus sp.]|nr:dephospho-CoA kinase [Luminiphilus sp.]
LAARVVVEPGQPALEAIAEHFGAHILQHDGHLDRAALRKIVFEDPQARTWLESVTHPAIRQEIESQLQSATSPYVVLSSPLLLEAKQHRFVNHVVVVDVTEELQVARTTVRDSNSVELVQKIMAAQLPRTERISRADEVIDNSGTLTDLEAQADALHRRMLERATKHAGRS